MGTVTKVLQVTGMCVRYDSTNFQSQGTLG